MRIKPLLYAWTAKNSMTGCLADGISLMSTSVERAKLFINGAEGFWCYAKNCLVKFHDIIGSNFYPHSEGT
jgi:hypothetical protein